MYYVLVQLLSKENIMSFNCQAAGPCHPTLKSVLLDITKSKVSMNDSIDTIITMSICTSLYCRRKCEGEFMDGRCSVDVTQSESDLPDFNQSEH